jgi:hypothetical protein
MFKSIKTIEQFNRNFEKNKEETIEIISGISF